MPVSYNINTNVKQLRWYPFALTRVNTNYPVITFLISYCYCLDNLTPYSMTDFPVKPYSRTTQSTQAISPTATKELISELDADSLKSMFARSIRSACQVGLNKLALDILNPNVIELIRNGSKSIAEAKEDLRKFEEKYKATEYLANEKVGFCCTGKRD